LARKSTAIPRAHGKAVSASNTPRQPTPQANPSSWFHITTPDHRARPTDPRKTPPRAAIRRTVATRKSQRRSVPAQSRPTQNWSAAQPVDQNHDRAAFGTIPSANAWQPRKFDPKMAGRIACSSAVHRAWRKGPSARKGPKHEPASQASAQSSVVTAFADIGASLDPACAPRRSLAMVDRVRP